MGGKLGTIFARAGHEVVFSYARSETKLKMLARAARGESRAGTPREAAQEADAVLLAVHWSRIGDVLNQAGDLSGKVVVTCSLPMNEDSTELVVAHTSSGAEELAKLILNARVVAAFQTVPTSGIVSFQRKPSPIKLTDRWQEGPLRDEMTTGQGCHHHRGSSLCSSYRFSPGSSTPPQSSRVSMAP
jgi:predicted dinucleotide-binding enzyme